MQDLKLLEIKTHHNSKFRPFDLMSDTRPAIVIPCIYTESPKGPKHSFNIPIQIPILLYHQICGYSMQHHICFHMWISHARLETTGDQDGD